MGMESFNAEPVVPDESERIEDRDKAEAMARASDVDRTLAVGNRKVSTGENPIIDLEDDSKFVNLGGSFGQSYHKDRTNEEIKDLSAENAERLDRKADAEENAVAENYDKGGEADK